MNRIIVLARRNFLEMLRDKISLLLGLAMPSSFLLLFYFMGQSLPIDMFKIPSLAPGIVVFSFAFLSMFSAMLLSKDRTSGVFDRIRTTPIRAWELTLAYSLPFMGFSLLQIVVGYGVAVLLGLPINVAMLESMVMLVPIAIASIGIGLLMGALLTEGQISAVGSIFITYISIFGGAWMDLKEFGGFLERVGYATPFAHAIDLAREALGVDRHMDVGFSLSMVIGLSALLYLSGMVLLHVKSKGSF